MFMLIALCSCTFMEKQDSMELPKYTETGENIAGALIDNSLWISRSVTGAIGSDSVVRLSFEPGVLYMDSEITKSHSISFYLTGATMQSYRDLALLNDTTIVLDGKGNYAVTNASCELEICEQSTGTLTIKRATLEKINDIIDRQKHLYYVILSGTFKFKSESCDDCRVREGRFDFTVDSTMVQSP